MSHLNRASDIVFSYYTTPTEQISPFYQKQLSGTPSLSTPSSNMLLFLLNAARISIAGMLLVGVLVAIMLRLSLFWLSQHPSQVSAWLSEHWQTQIQIAQLQSDWSQGLPRLQIQDLVLGDPPHSLPIAQATLAWNTHGLSAKLTHALGPIWLSTTSLSTLDTLRITWPALSEQPIRLQYDPVTSQVNLQATNLSLAPLYKLIATLPVLGDTLPEPLQLIGVLRDIQITWSPHHLRATLAADHATLDYPGLFRAPLSITHLTAGLQGSRTDAGTWQLTADSLQLNTPHFSSNSQLQLTLSAQHSPHLDLRTRLRDGQLAAVTHYLPAPIMSPELVRWLDRALRNGQIVQSDLVLSGSLDHLPDTTKLADTFSVITQIRAATLAFHPDWPLLHIDQLQLTFKPDLMLADLTAGRLLNSPVQTHARIAHLSTDGPLQLDITADGPTADLLTLLQTPSLSPAIRQLAAKMQASGTAHSQLQIQLPLHARNDPTQVNGTIHLTDTDLQLADVRLDQISGTLSVQDNRLQAEAVQALLRERPVRLAIRPEAEQTVVLLDKQLNADTITAWLPHFPTQLVRGSTPAQLSLTIPRNPLPEQWFNQLRLHSDLRGLAIRLPSPLGKTRYTTRPLQLTLSLDHQNQPHTLRYGRDGHGIFSHDWQRGALSYTRPLPRLPAAGYHLSGTFAQLDLAAWQALWQDIPTTNSATPWQIDVSADQLAYGTLRSDQAQLHVTRQQQQIQGTLDSQQISGEVHYDAARHTLKGYLRKAYLSWPEELKERPDVNFTNSAHWPELALLCDDMRINQRPLGTLMLRTQHNATTQTLKQLSVQGDNLQLQLQGSWHQPDNQTRLAGRFQFSDLGTWLTGWGYPRQLHDSSAQGDVALHWTGRPEQFDLARLQGKAGIRLGPGRLTQVSPGITRMLGLVNVDALQRRLKLDFDDLLKKGHSFDQIQGNFQFGEGQARTHNLHINGPTSYIQLAGRIGLMKQDLEQLVYVIPKLDGTLLLAGALAGGPVGTLTSLLVQQLLRRQVDSLTRFTYQVTGTWEQPEIIDISTGQATSEAIQALRKQVAKPRQRGVLQRIRDALRSTDTSTGWTDEELLQLDE